jgi:uncharacterized membrane protein
MFHLVTRFARNKCNKCHGRVLSGELLVHSSVLSGVVVLSSIPILFSSELLVHSSVLSGVVVLSSIPILLSSELLVHSSVLVYLAV